MPTKVRFYHGDTKKNIKNRLNPLLSARFSYFAFILKDLPVGWISTGNEENKK